MVGMMKRGEVWTANLNPNKGAEIGKIRPVLVLQDDTIITGGLPTIVVVPLTSQFRPNLAPLRIPIAPQGRLKAASYVMAEQLRAIDRSRFGEGPLATVTAEELAAVEKSLRGVMGLW
ncbi:type II toxin-antitoxin system PemK/MazF family toxin [Methylomonas sp. EbB]|uniref:mRNA interferase n=2 Tax=Methylomonas fluvii TaxID=1854564 RepID=A0ABR9DBQ8_9GAMM|nr:type II toxin-antitoxin system PemK/MazF family toxin [Methylomonas fluvii]